MPLSTNQIESIGPDIIKQVYPPRPRDAQKYDAGLLLVIGGSEFYSGSPALAALAAFRAGVDMVRILAPKRAADIIAGFSPNLAAFPIAGPRIIKECLPFLLEQVESCKLSAHGKVALVIGGGMGRTQEIQDAVAEFLSKISTSSVIDVDAIHSVAEKKVNLEGKPFLLAPHLFEFEILTGRNLVGYSDGERAAVVKAAAQKLKTTILLKGATDIISDGQRVAFNKTGHAFMTVGGTGDTLAGIAGALMAKGIQPFEAGCAAAYINGKAGEFAARELGVAMTAMDVVENIVKVINIK